MPAAPDSRQHVLPLIAVLCLIWGSTWWAIRVCVAEQPPLGSAAMRFAIAGLAMAALTPLLRRREAAPPPPRWLWMTAGATNFAISYGILYVAEQVVPSGTAAVLWAIFPLLMATSGVFVLGERLRARQWIGFAVSFAGIVLVASGDFGVPGEGSHLGWALLLLASPVVSAVGTTVVKKYGAKTSSVLLNRNGMLLGAAMLGIAAFVSGQPLARQWSWRSVLATLYLALFGTTLTFGIYFHLLRSTAASLLSLITYVTPVLAMLLALLVGDESPDLWGWIGSALVIVGIALVVSKRR